jgi:CTP synthase (UTP-ammonia lyase)
VRVLLLIDQPPTAPYHQATVDAINHAAQASGKAVKLQVSQTDRAAVAAGLPGVDGVVVGPGSPYRDEAAVWAVVRSAREHGVPLVGT